MKPLLWAFEFAFGCHHQLSGVFTIQKRTYRVCLVCGQEVEYSWALMHSCRLTLSRQNSIQHAEYQ